MIDQAMRRQERLTKELAAENERVKHALLLADLVAKYDDLRGCKMPAQGKRRPDLDEQEAHVDRPARLHGVLGGYRRTY